VLREPDFQDADEVRDCIQEYERRDTVFARRLAN
jgi:hypothetical protein